jgi:hypothetical protein
MASGIDPKTYHHPTSILKSKILRPALTSTYNVYFNANSIINYSSESKTFFANRGVGVDPAELLTLSCSEASLPGSSLATHEINNDFTGVTERHAYRRQYDDRTDFTFYVDGDYTILKFFETWISYIVGETQYTEQSKRSFNYRVKFPNDYRTNMHIQKYEKSFDSESSKYVEYTFIDAYPISINSIPVSYDSSQLLKVTVSLTYTRYYMENVNSLTPSTTIQTINVVDLPEGSTRVGSVDIGPNTRQSEWLTPDGRIVQVIEPVY